MKQTLRKLRGIFFPCLVLIATFLAWPGIVNGQSSWTWGRTAGGGNEQRGYAIAADSFGNVYVAGDIRGNNLNFGTHSISASGGKDAFVARYDYNGNNRWVIAAGSNSDDEAYGIALDGNGGVYVCGIFTGTMTFYGSSNITITSAGGPDAFVAKYDTLGNVLWAKDAGGSGPDEARGIATDGTNVYVTGDFSGTFTIGLLTALVSLGGKDIFLASYSCANGTENWAINGGSSAADEGAAVAADTSGVYMSGYFGNTCTFQNMPGSLTCNGGTDAFLVKYSTTGTGLWSRRAGSGNPDEAEAVCAAGGAVYMAGYFNNTISFYNTGPAVATLSVANNEDAFIAKYNAATGNFSWARSEHGNGNERAMSVTVSPAGRVFTAGYFAGTLPMGNGPSISASQHDPYVTEYDTAGTFLLGLTAPGSNEDYGYGITAPDYTSAYVTGYYNSSTLSFGSSSISNSGNDDVLVGKIGCTVSMPHASADQHLCSTTTTLNGNTPYWGTGTWSLVSGSGTIISPNATSTTINNLGGGTNVFAWTITFNSCQSPPDLVTINRDLDPTPANAGADQEICTSVSTLAGNTPLIGTASWSPVFGTGIIGNPNLPNSPVSNLTGTSAFVWQTTNGICPVSRDTVLISVDTMPSASSAGTDQRICSSATSLNANTPGIGNGVWQVVGGSGQFSNSLQPSTAVSNLLPGFNLFDWVITNGVCPSSHDTVLVRVDTLPSPANAGVDQELCTSTSTLNGNIPLVGSGTWSVFGGPATVTNSSLHNSSVANLVVGANKFIWTISSGVCPVNRDTMVMTVDGMPTVSSAGIDQRICSSTSSLNANTPAIGNGAWQLAGGSGQFSNSLQPSTAVSNLLPGFNLFDWVITNGVCPSSHDTVLVRVDTLPSPANAGVDQELCTSTSTLNGNIPLVGSGAWSVFGGPATVTNSSLHNSGVSNLAVGSNTFVWTISSGVCPATNDTIVITIDPLPTPSSAGTDQRICNDTTTLSGNVPVIGAGVWQLVNGNGQFSSSTQPSTTVSNLPAGFNLFDWVITNGVCPSSHDTVLVQVDTLPLPASAGVDQHLCATVSTLSGSVPSAGIGAWNVIGSSAAVNNVSLPNSSVSNLAVGANAFEWTITSGVCPVTRDTMIITVDAMPSVADAGLSRNICSSSATLNANMPAVGRGQWHVVNGTAALADSSLWNTTVTNLNSGANIFSWIITNGICPVSGDTVVIMVDTMPSPAIAGADQTVCDSFCTLNAAIPATGTGTWYAIGNGNAFNDAYLPNAQANALSPGSNAFEWVVSSGSCPASRDTVQVFYNLPPTPAVAGPDMQVCGQSTTLQALAPTTGMGFWRTLSSTAAIADTLDPAAAVANLFEGENYFLWTTVNNSCSDGPDTMIVTCYLPPTTADAGQDQLVHTTYATMSAAPVTTGTGTWSFVSGSGFIVYPHDPNTQVINLGEGENILRWTTSNGVCTETSDDVRIESRSLVVPSGFSPNEDGTNDDFEITGLLEYQDVSLEIFNRWGNLVFQSKDYRNDWRGTNSSGQELPDDVYYYVLSLKDGKKLSGYVIIKRDS